MLGDPIIEEHVTRSARGTRDTLGEPWIIRRDHIGSARTGNPRGEERLDQVGQPFGLYTNIGVGIRDDLSAGVGEADITGSAQTAVLHLDQPN